MRGRPSCGIVVPVRDEARVLERTVPALLGAAADEDARIVWVCNGCTDGSASLIRRLAGAGATVIDLPDAGKTGALQAGDDTLGDVFPRLYLDADVWMRPGDASRLLAPLRRGAADLTAPRLDFDLGGATGTAAAIARCWLSLPHAAHAAFSWALGFSRAGRSAWERWPALLGDDIFAASRIPPHRRLIVGDAVATSYCPPTFRAWVATRARWGRGERELRHLGHDPPAPVPGQRLALGLRLLTPGHAPGAAAFVASRVAGCLQGARPGPHDWRPDRSRMAARRP